jgi:hypothetical protein
MIAPEPLSQAEGKPHKLKSYTVRLEANCNQAWAAPAAFAILREQAALHDLSDIEGVFITVTLHAGGQAYPEQVAALSAKLDELYLGELEVMEERELRNG